MIGHQTTGAIEGVVISKVSHERLRVSVNGMPARLAIVLDDGTIVSAGDDVAREAEAVTLNCYRNVLQGKGYLRVLSAPLRPEIVASKRSS